MREAIRPFPKPMLRELYDDGHTSVFEQLIACILSIRTREEASIVASRQLFARARTPAALAELDPAEISRLTRLSSYHTEKSFLIQHIARRTQDEFGGQLPCDFDVLTSFRGVGPKCANLVLGIACGIPAIGVDIHVHRITNRWGYVSARTPEQTMGALERVLPRDYWIEINALLVPFGKHICTPTRPRCSTCPLLDMCAQVGVTTHR